MISSPRLIKKFGRIPMTDEEAEHLEMKGELAHGI